LFSIAFKTAEIMSGRIGLMNQIGENSFQGELIQEHMRERKDNYSTSSDRKTITAMIPERAKRNRSDF